MLVDTTASSNNTLDDVPQSPDTTVAGPPAESLLDSQATHDEPVENPQLRPNRSELLATAHRGDASIFPDQSDAAAPVPAKMAMSQKQKGMLDDKFRKWTENYYKMARSEPSIGWEYKGQEYRATFSQQPAANDMGIDRVTVEVSTEENGNRMSTKMHMRRLAFSSFGQFVDRWDPNVNIHDDELDGRFHANSKIYLQYNRKVKPRFNGKVSTSSRSVDTTDSRGRFKREEIFLGGLETGVKRILLPKRISVPSQEGGDRDLRRFEQHTRITFYPDGSYGWQDAESTGAEQRHRISPRGSYLIGARKKKLYVKGAINGKVLVYSPERIVIEGNLTYTQDPTTASEGGDYLGLVSGKVVEIASPRVTGPGDLVINAAIHAKRRFITRGYGVRENSILFIYGSLTAGSLSATEPRYSTRIEFDKRLENTRPPGFPMSDRYEIEAWDGLWEIESHSKKM